MFQACNKKADVETQTIPIGKGVEIYRAKLTWKPKKVGQPPYFLDKIEIVENTPLINYNQIISYATTIIKGDDYIFTTESSVNFTNLLSLANEREGMPIEGFAVTVDKEVIFGGYHKPSTSSLPTYAAFISGPATNILRIGWITNIGGDDRSDEIDPRHDPRLLDRLRQDGKWKE